MVETEAIHFLAAGRGAEPQNLHNLLLHAKDHAEEIRLLMAYALLDMQKQAS